jgi:hypothetical protein
LKLKKRRERERERERRGKNLVDVNDETMLFGDGVINSSKPPRMKKMKNIEK